MCYAIKDWIERSLSCNSNGYVASCVWSSNKIVAVVSRIANSCVGQAVIFIIIVVSIKCEQWHKSSANNKEFLSEIKNIFIFTWFAIIELVFKRF